MGPVGRRAEKVRRQSSLSRQRAGNEAVLMEGFPWDMLLTQSLEQVNFSPSNT